MRWIYGVTTVPERRETTLPCTLASLRRGGFDEPRLFVDGSDDVLGWERWAREVGRSSLPITCRMPRVGVIGNWILALWELHLRDPRADRYALFQDDLTTCLNVRQYLERSPWPGRGYLNLYTFTRGNEAVVADKPRGWHEAGLVNPVRHNPNLLQTGRGAVALVFNREALSALLSSQPLVEKVWAADPRTSTKRLDGGIVNAMNLKGFREYIHNPSLVQHTGAVSSIGNDCDRKYGLAQTYLGEDLDCLTLLQG